MLLSLLLQIMSLTCFVMTDAVGCTFDISVPITASGPQRTSQGASSIYYCQYDFRYDAAGVKLEHVAGGVPRDIEQTKKDIWKATKHNSGKSTAYKVRAGADLRINGKDFLNQKFFESLFWDHRFRTIEPDSVKLEQEGKDVSKEGVWLKPLQGGEGEEIQFVMTARATFPCIEPDYMKRMTPVSRDSKIPNPNTKRRLADHDAIAPEEKEDNLKHHQQSMEGADQAKSEQSTGSTLYTQFVVVLVVIILSIGAMLQSYLYAP